MRLALLDNSTAAWTASVSFTRMLALSLQAVSGDDVELGFLTAGDALPGTNVPRWPITAASFFPGEITLRRFTGAEEKSALLASLRAHRIDVVLPLLDLRRPLPGIATVGWIPDFQYLHLPQFFTAAELTKHREMTHRLAAGSTRLLLSSRDALRDLGTTEPSAASKAEAIPFPSLFAFEPPPAAVGDAVGRYGLPEKFLLVANQFWAHKNHRVVVDALRILRLRGLRVPAVFTGLPLDHRAAGNRPLSDLLQTIAQAGIHDDVRVLGAVPFPDLVDLMRSAALIVQPSRFEGWSTVVQDALALGRPVACSDLPVHREQAPGAIGFFGVDDPEALADLLATQWSALLAGPNLTAETAALTDQRAFARQHGERLLALCRDAANHAS